MIVNIFLYLFFLVLGSASISASIFALKKEAYSVFGFYILIGVTMAAIMVKIIVCGG